jgi:hypothetical protein
MIIDCRIYFWARRRSIATEHTVKSSLISDYSVTVTSGPIFDQVVVDVSINRRVTVPMFDRVDFTVIDPKAKVRRPYVSFDGLRARPKSVQDDTTI